MNQDAGAFKWSSEDGPRLDLSHAAVQQIIRLAKKRGYVTYDELDQVLPADEFSPEQIEDVLNQLAEMGIDREHQPDGL
ncbi:RNA polymerase sigma factor region1.1 domain-containing protein [Microvirga aerilata]|uniref:RNA polymerase sigma factor region1.1 domain-containing protein n=1 Tax=Microvirga aerilata TaxID=670292 RepID=UPI0035E40DA9